METLIKMDDLGAPLFLETPIWIIWQLLFKWVFQLLLRPVKGRCVEQKRTVTTKRWLMDADASDKWESNNYQLAAGASPFFASRFH